jgi:RecB family exonuclease
MRNASDVAEAILPGMPRRLLRASPKSLADFSDCPRRYRYANVDRPTPPRGPRFAHHTVGTALHKVLSAWWDLPVERRTTGAARQLLYADWSPAGFRDAEQSDRWRARAAGWLTDYVAGLDPTEEPRARERTVSTMTERMTLCGRVDRIDERGDELVVVDYKTGRSPADAEDARSSLALALYAVAAARTLRGRCTRVELHHLPSGRVAAHDHTPASLAEHVARAEEIAEQATAAAEGLAADGDRDALFPPRTSPGCGWCDFLRVCPSGRAAVGTARRPWDGLAAELGAPNEAA